MGARKVALFALTQIGCTPLATSKFGTDGKPCVKSINKAAMLFNHKFKPLVDQLNANNEDALFTFINITSILYPQGGKTRAMILIWDCIPYTYLVS